MKTTKYRFSEHAPDPYLMDWMSQHLPGARNYFVTDVDLVIRNRQGCMMIVEVKRKGAKLKPHQRNTLAIIDTLIRAGIQMTGNTIAVDGMPIPVYYVGYFTLTLEGTTFEDGRIFFDGHEVSEQQLITILSMDFKCCEAA